MRIAFSLAVGAVMLMTGCTRSPEVAKCRAQLDAWVPIFKAVYASPDCQGDGSPSCPFATEPIRNLDTLDLSKIPFAAEACAKTDPKNEFMYERVAARAENIIVMRAGQFLVQTQQDDAYAGWEQSHLKPKSTDVGEDLQARFMPVGWTTK